MNRILFRAAFAATLGFGINLGVQADSFMSTASSAGSASVGSVSDSMQSSSRSSGGDKKVADGDYRVIQVAALEDAPDHVRLHLQAGDDVATAFTLKLPRKALGEHGMAVGDLVNVRNRAYGLAFARAVQPMQGVGNAPRLETFFLALDDAWRNDLDSRLVKS